MNAELRLPWGPTINHYYRPGKRPGSLFLSKAGHGYRANVIIAVLQQKPLRFTNGERLHLFAEFTPPDRRKFDLDNRFKPLLDALQAAEVYADDAQIDRLEAVRLAPKKNEAFVFVKLWEVAGA